MKSARSSKIAGSSALLLLVLTVPAAIAQSSTGGDIPDAIGLLQRIERNKAISPETSQWLRQQAQSGNEPGASVELLLLDMFGPGATLADEQALERVQGLLAMADVRWSRDSLQLLQLMADHLDRIASLRRESAQLRQQLELERRAHAETRAKLDAIRRIDQELERRDESAAGVR